jgi:hypothetical protein
MNARGQAIGFHPGNARMPEAIEWIGAAGGSDHQSHHANNSSE